MSVPDAYIRVETAKSDTYYWKHKEKDLNVRVQSDGGDGFDFDVVVDGKVEPVGFYDSEESAVSEAELFMSENVSPSREMMDRLYNN